MIRSSSTYMGSKIVFFYPHNWRHSIRWSTSPTLQYCTYIYGHVGGCRSACTIRGDKNVFSKPYRLDYALIRFHVAKVFKTSVNHSVLLHILSTYYVGTVLCVKQKLSVYDPIISHLGEHPDAKFHLRSRPPKLFTSVKSDEDGNSVQITDAMQKLQGAENTVGAKLTCDRQTACAAEQGQT